MSLIDSYINHHQEIGNYSSQSKDFESKACTNSMTEFDYFLI